MDISLSKVPKNPIMINGFPGFGLVGSIATEFLIEHCACEQIGSYWFDKMPATLAVHDGKIIKPINIHYNEQRNLLIVHAISSGPGMEWEVSEFVDNLARKVEAKEILSLEGVGTESPAEKPGVYFVTSDHSRKGHWESLGTKELKEGILVGVTSALLLKSSFPITALFAETHSELPDSKASAQIIQVLNKYLSLDVDTKPLLEQAKRFEDKLNNIIKQGANVQSQMRKKQLNYVG